MMTELFSELKAENQRLKTELIFTNRCLNVLLKFKNNLIHIFDLKSSFSTISLSTDDIRRFRDIDEEYNNILKENHIKTEQIDTKDEYSSDQLKSNGSEDDSSQDKPLPNEKINTEDEDIDKTIEKQGIKLSPIVLNEKPIIQTVVLPKTLTDENQLKKMVCNVFRININDIKKVVTQQQKPKVTSKPMIQHLTVPTGVSPLKGEPVTNVSVSVSDLNNRKFIVMKVENNWTEENTGYKCCSIPTTRTNEYKCPINECFYETDLKEQLNQHLHKCHKHIVRFKCKICEKGFVTKVSLQNHMRCHKERTVECTFPGCHKRFKDKRAVYTHRLTHSNVYPFKCDVKGCDYKTKFRGSLQSHLNNVHSDERLFACDFSGCQSKFKMKSSLKQHKLTHLKRIRNFKCDLEGCAKHFPDLKSLKTHMNCHSSEKMSCVWPGCQYTTNTRAKLRYHQMVHSEERNFICDWPQCGKRFKNNQYLILHQRIHTNERPHHCDWPGCEHKSRTASNLTIHRRIHMKYLEKT